MNRNKIAARGTTSLSLLLALAALAGCAGAINEPDAVIGGAGGTRACGTLEAAAVARRIGAEGDFGNAIALGPGGEMVVTGELWGTSDLGAGPVEPVGQPDAFVTALDAKGATLWSRTFGSHYASGAAIAVGPGREVVITGTLLPGLDLGGGPLCTNGSDARYFVLGLSPEGEHAYSFCLSGTDEIYLTQRLAMDDAGNAIWALRFMGSLTIAGYPHHAGASPALLLVKLDPAGQAIWAKSFGGDADGWVDLGGVAFAGTDIVVAGSLSGSVDFGNGPLTNLEQASPNAFLARLDAEGNTLWSKVFQSVPSQRAGGVAVGPSGDIAIGVEAFVTTSFGGPPLGVHGDRDVFLAVFDAGGEHRWSKSFGSRQADSVVGLAWSPDDTISLVISPGGDIDMGCGELPIHPSRGFLLARFDGKGTLKGARFSANLEASGVAARGDKVAITGSMGAEPLTLGAWPVPGEGGVVVAAWGE